MPALPSLPPGRVYGVLSMGAALIARATRAVWREQRRWTHAHKEVVWRFWADALPTAARMHGAGATCLCGAAVPGRAHHYRDCPVAAAVLAELGRVVGAPSLHASHVWLMLPPAGLHAGLWRVVCVAAIAAMDGGRRAANARAAERARAAARRLASLPPGQRQLTEFFQPSAPATAANGGDPATAEAPGAAAARARRQLRVQAAAQQAVARMWELLAEFAAARVVPRELLRRAPEVHPFLQRDGDRLRVVHPV